MALKIPSLLLCEGGKYNDGPPTTCCHIQERCSHFVTKVPVTLIKNTSVQGQNLIQIQTRLIHGRQWLSQQNHKESEDEEIKGMQINVNAIRLTTNVPECMTVNDLKEVLYQDKHIQQLKEYIIQGWPENKDQLLQDIRIYWMFRDDMEVIDVVIVKG